MKKILFVDDEVDVLEGLKDALHQHTRRWEMTFSCGGESALDDIRSNRYDVVVSDIRMPVVDGIAVLQFVKDVQPEAIRIALTGYSDLDKTIKLTSLAQRYLTKPCNVDELDEAICRDLELVEAFDNPAVKRLAGRAGRLPGSSENQQALLESLNNVDSSLDDIAAIVEKDIALTAKILQLANSSFFRRQSSLDSAKLAVGYLGVDVIRSLVLANQLFELSNKLDGSQHIDSVAIQRHCLLTATIAKEILEGSEHASAAFTAGLLHDVGKLLIALNEPTLLDTLMSKDPDNQGRWPNTETERQIMACSHAEVGGCFLNLWGIPTAVVEAATFHDTPSSVFSRHFDAVAAVHVANYLAHWVDGGQDDVSAEHKLNRSYIAAYMTPEQEQQWKAIAVDSATDLGLLTHNNSSRNAA